MSKHTPGPWHLKLGTYGAPHEVSWNPTKSYGGIARIPTPSFSELPEAKRAPEVEANARLIAAAPELLEALERLLPIAIGHAKDATGLGSFTDDGQENEWPWVQRSRAAIAKAKGETP